MASADVAKAPAGVSGAQTNPDPRADWTAEEKITGIRVRDMIELFMLSQTMFRTFNGHDGMPAVTDEQLRTFLIPLWPFERTQIKLYQLLTRRSTTQHQFKELIRQHKEAAQRMMQEDVEAAATTAPST